MAAAAPICHYALDPENGDGRHGEYRAGNCQKAIYLHTYSASLWIWPMNKTVPIALTTPLALLAS